MAPATAQEAISEQVEIGESGNAYLRAIRLRGIESDVTYFAPGAPAPEFETNQNPSGQPDNADENNDSQQNSEGRWFMIAIAAMVVLLIAYLFLRYGGAISVSFGSGEGNAERRHTKQSAEAPAWAERTGSFQDILRMKDKRRALVLLTQKVLAATVTANGILMQRSWTARDALRHLPTRQQHLDLLKNLVLVSERVQFGDREVSEEDFRSHAADCQRVLGTNPA